MILRVAHLLLKLSITFGSGHKLAGGGAMQGTSVALLHHGCLQTGRTTRLNVFSVAAKLAPKHSVLSVIRQAMSPFATSTF